MDDKVNTYGDTHSNPTLAPSSNIFKHTKLKRSMQDSAMKASKENMKKKFHAKETYPRREVHVKASTPLQ